MVKQSSRARQKRAGPARKHRWLRWVAAGLATVVVLAFAGLFVFIHFLGGPVPAPLALPKLNAAAAGTGSAPVDGTWMAGRGSLAGYRVREEFLGPGNTMAGRTSAVTGRVVIAHAVVTSASFRVDLAAVTVNGKAQPQLAKILDTARFPPRPLPATAERCWKRQDRFPSSSPTGTSTPPNSCRTTACWNSCSSSGTDVGLSRPALPTLPTSPRAP